MQEGNAEVTAEVAVESKTEEKTESTVEPKIEEKRKPIAEKPQRNKDKSKESRIRRVLVTSHEDCVKEEFWKAFFLE